MYGKLIGKLIQAPVFVISKFVIRGVYCTVKWVYDGSSETATRLLQNRGCGCGCLTVLLNSTKLSNLERFRTVYERLLSWKGTFLDGTRENSKISWHWLSAVLDARLGIIGWSLNKDYPRLITCLTKTNSICTFIRGIRKPVTQSTLPQLPLVRRQVTYSGCGIKGHTYSKCPTGVQ